MDSIGSEVKSLLIQYAIKAVMEKLVSLTGFFALPIINPIVSLIVTKLVTYLVEETALGLSLLWISLNIQYSVDSVENATEALKKMLDNPKAYTEEEQHALEDDFDSSAINLIKLSLVKLQPNGP